MRTWTTIVAALAACNETRKPADHAGEAARPQPPQTTSRTVAHSGRVSLDDLGFAVSLEVPANAKLLWLDGSPDELRHKAGTVRVSHDAGEGIFREQGLRLYVRRPVPREPTELSRMEAWLPRERDQLQAELDELDTDADKLEVSIAHREVTPTGWELAWTFEGEDGAYWTKVWRADLKLFCIDMLASRETIAGTLTACRTLAPIR